jgi:hypothetical protein
MDDPHTHNKQLLINLEPNIKYCLYVIVLKRGEFTTILYVT